MPSHIGLWNRRPVPFGICAALPLRPPVAVVPHRVPPPQPPHLMWVQLAELSLAEPLRQELSLAEPLRQVSQGSQASSLWRLDLLAQKRRSISTHRRARSQERAYERSGWA
jgi:hypothetical protein